MEVQVQDVLSFLQSEINNETKVYILVRINEYFKFYINDNYLFHGYNVSLVYLEWYLQ